MKNKTIRFRVTEEEYTKIVELSGGNISSWILSRILPMEVEPYKTSKTVVSLVKSIMEGKEINEVKAGIDMAFPNAESTIHRCQAANCKSIDTAECNIDGCKVWLCEEHG